MRVSPLLRSRSDFAHALAISIVAAVLVGACGSSSSPAAAGSEVDGGGPAGEQHDSGEADTGCGGPNAPPCAGVPPRPDDGAKNGDETDVDCGGTVAPKCQLGKSCAKHGDCESDACAYDGKCIARRSCTPHHGGDTCGPTNAQGDCCESIAVPRPAAQGGAYTLDKYVVTAGRMRAFVERTSGNIRGFIQSNRPKWFQAAWDDYLPTTLDDPDDGNTGLNGVYQQLGPWKLVSVGGTEPGNRGCNVEGPGARTYWVPKEINDRWEDRQRYAKDDLDEKAIVCVTQYMMAAFCAWDGGRLPTVAEISYAYTGGEGRKYPWGNSPAAAAFGSTAYDDLAAAGPVPDTSRFANHEYNWWSPSERIDNDYTVYIAPPGRFPDGNGKFGHSDLGGLALEWTSDLSAGKAQMFHNGSWEFVHMIENVSKPQNALAKYYAITARCAR